jgi:hypothetical protein
LESYLILATTVCSFIIAATLDLQPDHFKWKWTCSIFRKAIAQANDTKQLRGA